MTARWVAPLLALSAACLTPAVTEAPPAPERPAVLAGPNPFLHARGRDLVDGEGRKVVLKGICFGNDVWMNPASPPSADLIRVDEG